MLSATIEKNLALTNDFVAEEKEAPENFVRYRSFS